VYYECFEDEEETIVIPLELEALEINGTEIREDMIAEYNRRN
jgi:hypothetical protein